jgi:hypothetical protein
MANHHRTKLLCLFGLLFQWGGASEVGVGIDGPKSTDESAQKESSISFLLEHSFSLVNDSQNTMFIYSLHIKPNK